MQIEIPSATRERLRERLVVASISGGKDSTALALLLRELEIPHVRVFADTGFEAPETYAYLDTLRERLGPVDVVRNETLWKDALPGEEGMLTLIRRKQMFPSRLMRFCTQKLKLHPIRDYVRALQTRGDELVNAVGVRAEESAARALMAEWEFWDEMDVDIWRPLLGWSEQDVIDMHRRHALAPNPLYLKGARRVGCYPCIHARKKDLRLLPAEQLVKIRRVEDELTADATRRGCDRPTRAFFQIRGEGGRLQFAPIDDVVGLAHLHRGKPILEDAEPAGCVRWGLCEQSPSSSVPTLPTSPPRRFIGHDQLEYLGAPPETIAAWLVSGILQATEHDGFYERTPELDERLGTRRTIGRGHLLALGMTHAAIARWLRHGVLRRTDERGFYSVAQVAFDGLLAAAKSAATPVEAPQPVEARPDRLRVVPCTIGQARAFVAEHHRHLGPPVSGLFAVGLARGAELVGVAIVGRPVARQLQDGATAEVTRVCTRGDRNACSMLLAACRRGALALGYRRLVTYTLRSELGTSLKAAGWQQVGEVRGRSWDCPSRRRTPTRSPDKRRWETPSLSSARHTKENLDVAA